MPPTFSFPASGALSLALLALTASASQVVALPPLRMEARDLVKRDSPVGCYSSSQGLNDQGTFTFQSTGHCAPICQGQGAAVYALSGGNDCWCGNTLPPANSKVEDSQCNTPCNGYPSDICGASGFYSLYLTGSKSNVPNYGESGSSGTSSASTASSTGSPSATSHSAASSAIVVTSVAPGQTIVVTQPATQQSGSATPKSSSGGGTSTAGIAAGVVVGVVAAAAAIAALVFWIRHKRKQEAEEEYRRQTQVSDFMRGTGERKAPATGYSYGSDQRLDPEAGARRNSQGSIADAGDYSRRILRVANPDSS